MRVIVSRRVEPDSPPEVLVRLDWDGDGSEWYVDDAARGVFSVVERATPRDGEPYRRALRRLVNRSSTLSMETLP